MKYLKLSLIALWAFLAPIHTLILTTLFFVAVDLFTGLLAAKKRKEPITSAGLKTTVVKLLVYQSVIFLMFVCQKDMLNDLLPLVNLASTYISITELTSILENLESLTGQPILTSMIAKLSRKLK